MFDEKLFILIPKDLKEKIKGIADEEYKTVSDYVRGLIIKDVKKRNNKEEE